MKKLVITHKQLQLLEGLGDDRKSLVQFDGDNANQLGNNAQEKFDDALRSGLKRDAITMNGKTRRNNANDDNETIINFDSTNNSIRDAVTNAVNNAVNNGADIDKINVQGNPEDLSNNELAESRTFKKSDIEKARLDEMRRNGTVMKKGTINEGTLETAEANKMIKKLYKAVEKYTRNKYQDDDWHNLNQVFDEIRNIPGVKDLSVGNGRYHGYFSDSPSKTYELWIGLDCGVILGGELTCHAAGTMQQPFSSYDITCSFFKKSE